MALHDGLIEYEPEPDDESWVEPPRPPVRQPLRYPASPTDNEVIVLAGKTGLSLEEVAGERREKILHDIQMAQEILAERAGIYAQKRSAFNKIDKKRHLAGQELKIAADALDAAQERLDSLRERHGDIRP